MLGRPFKTTAFWAAASLAVAWACSGCDSDPQCVIDTDCDGLQVCNTDQQCVPRGGGTDASVDGGVGDAGGGGGDGGMDASSGDGGMDAGSDLVGTGSLVATSNQDLRTDAGGVASDYRVTASFAYAGEDDSPCTTETVGPCEVTECTPPSMDAGVSDGGVDAGAVDAGAMDAGEPMPPPTAGSIQVTGGTVEAVTLTESGGIYPPQTGTQALWTAAGTTLTAESAGFGDDPVPEFVATAETPVDVTIAAPALDAPPTIMRSVPLEVQWSGTSSVGSLVMRLSGPGLGGGGATTSASCTFDVDSEETTSGTVPTTVLSSFAAGPGSLTFTVESSKTTEVDGWRITFNARSFAKKASPPGGKASTSVTLE